MSINRVLWVDDITSNDSNSRLFIKDETTIVKTMDEALKVFSDNSLYRYDTVVLDINFENGITNQEDVIQDLTNSLFLSDEQKENDYIIKYGGYLLFLYLLVKGYPSDNVAFLTGNPGMLRELKAYMDRHVKKLTNIEIKQRFLDFWIQNRNTNEKFNEKHKRFLMMAKNSATRNGLTLRQRCTQEAILSLLTQATLWIRWRRAVDSATASRTTSSHTLLVLAVCLPALSAS